MSVNLTWLATRLTMISSQCALISRTDAIYATHITSTIDPADRPFILGATTKPGVSLSSLAAPEHAEKRTQWLQTVKMQTLDAAVESQVTFGEFAVFQERSAGLNTADAKLVATEMFGQAIVWDCDVCRTCQGWYAYNGGMEAAIDRAKRHSPLADVLWYCATGYNHSQAFKFANGLESHLDGST